MKKWIIQSIKNIDYSIVLEKNYVDPYRSFAKNSSQTLQNIVSDIGKFTMTMMENTANLGIGLLEAGTTILGVNPNCYKKHKISCLNEGYKLATPEFNWCIKGKCISQFPVGIWNAVGDIFENCLLSNLRNRDKCKNNGMNRACADVILHNAVELVDDLSCGKIVPFILEISADWKIDYSGFFKGIGRYLNLVPSVLDLNLRSFYHLNLYLLKMYYIKNY